MAYATKPQITQGADYQILTNNTARSCTRPLLATREFPSKKGSHFASHWEGRISCFGPWLHPLTPPQPQSGLFLFPNATPLSTNRGQCTKRKVFR